MYCAILRTDEILPREPPHKRELEKKLQRAVDDGSWVDVPPLKLLEIPDIFSRPERFVVWDGNNRYAVAEKNGLHVRALVLEETDDAVHFSDEHWGPPLGTTYYQAVMDALRFADVYRNLRTRWWWNISPSHMQDRIYMRKCMEILGY